jgi:hypothetical protein
MKTPASQFKESTYAVGIACIVVSLLAPGSMAIWYLCAGVSMFVVGLCLPEY